MIDGGCYLSFDLVALNLPVPLIRGIRKGFVLRVTQIFIPRGTEKLVGRSSWFRSSSYLSNSHVKPAKKLHASKTDIT